MKRLTTLRVRFALGLGALILAAFVAFGAFVYFSLELSLSDSIDDSLTLSAGQIIANLDIIDGQINLAESLSENDPLVVGLYERGITFDILDPSGQLMQSFGSSSRPVTPPDLLRNSGQPPNFMTENTPPEPYPVRIYTVPILSNGQVVGRLRLARSLDTVEETLAHLLTSLLISGSLIVILAVFCGYLLVARALAPIDQITHTARRIASGGQDLSARLNLAPTDDEVGRLGTTFDAMLARLDESFKRERQFTADASHELRTPLAAMQAILSVLRTERRTVQDYEQALADLAEETNRLSSLTEDLLRLARGDTRQLVAHEAMDLSSLLLDVTDSLRPLAEAKGLELICDAPNDLCVSGDRDALVRLFVNLIDNAVKHTEQGNITLAAHSNSDTIRATVSDTGCGISPKDLPHIFNRFYRADSSRASSGAGLGLAIALEIARAHGGDIQARSIPGTGSSFTVQLPRLS